MATVGDEKVFEFEREGEAAADWQERIDKLLEVVAESAILTDEDYSVRVNALDDGTTFVE